MRWDASGEISKYSQSRNLGKANLYYRSKDIAIGDTGTHSLFLTSEGQ